MHLCSLRLLSIRVQALRRSEVQSVFGGVEIEFFHSDHVFIKLALCMCWNRFGLFSCSEEKLQCYSIQRFGPKSVSWVSTERKPLSV